MSQRRVLSFAEMVREHFERKNVGVPIKPIDGPEVWDDETVDLKPIELDAIQQQEFEMASFACLEDRETELPALAYLAKRINYQAHHKGFCLVENIPFDRIGEGNAVAGLFALAELLGNVCEQNPDGHRIGIVENQGATEGYQSNKAIDWHTDFADLLLLLCLQPSIVGGKTEIASSAAVFNAMGMPERLFSPIVDLQPCAFDGRRLRTFWHSDYFIQSSQTTEDVAFASAYRNMADPIAVAPTIRRGTLLVLNNHLTLHRRTAFEDPEPNEDEEPTKRRFARIYVSTRANTWK